MFEIFNVDSTQKSKYVNQSRRSYMFIAQRVPNCQW